MQPIASISLVCCPAVGESWRGFLTGAHSKIKPEMTVE